MNGQLDQLIEDYLDDTLDGEGAVVLARAVHAGGADAERVREAVALAGLLGQALDESDEQAFLRGFDERLRAEDASSDFAHAVERALPGGTTRTSNRRASIGHSSRDARRGRRRSSSFAPWLLATAAGFALLAAAWLLLVPAIDATRCRLVAGGGDLERDGRITALLPDQVLEAGDVVVAGGGLTIGWGDRSTLVLSGGSRLRLMPSDAGKCAELELGGLEAEVAPQPPGRPLVLTTARARVEVVGTHFTLRAERDASQLEVTKGEVAFADRTDARPIAVRAGFRAVVAPGAVLAAVPIHDPAAGLPAAPPSRAAAKPTTSAAGPWRDLFPGDSLAGWTQQHGAWTIAGGVVSGSDRLRHGHARLLSERDYRDLELECHLRIIGVDRCEVQVGSYDWFYSVPAAAPGATRAVRLVQHDGVLSCTVDGMPLPREAGRGDASMPAGELAFYVMAGGTLEITAAKIRLPAGE